MTKIKDNDISKAREDLEQLLDRQVSEYAEEEEAEVREIVEQELAEEKAPLAPPENLSEAPCDETTIKGPDGKALCLFGADVWPLLYHGRTTNVNFVTPARDGEVSFSGAEKAPLRRLMKTLFYFKLPDTWAGSNAVSVGSAMSFRSTIRYFGCYLLDRGFLMDLPSAPPKPLSLLNVEDLKATIRKSIADNTPAHHTSRLFSLITFWLRLCEFVDVPEEFRLPFDHADWSGDVRFEHEVTTYEVKVGARKWQAIEYDDLVRLLGNAQRYTQDYCNDILFLNDRLVELNETGEYALAPYGETKGIYRKIVTKRFTEDVSGSPWFAPQYQQKDQILSTQAIKDEVWLLLQSCIFLLLFWTGVRALELVNIKLNGLFINGRRFNPTKNAVKVFRDAVGKDGEKTPNFELEFTTFKLAKKKKGKLRKIPLTRDGARAFCILVELVRPIREPGNEYLFPPAFAIRGGGGDHNSVQEDKLTPSHTENIRNHLKLMVDGLNKRYGWQIDRIHPHQTRKSIATIIINKNPDAFDLIQKMLGHRHPSMTLRYLMQMPGIAEPIKNHLIETNRKRIVDIMLSAASLRLAGQKGTQILASFNKNAKRLKAKRVVDTIEEYVETLTGDPNLIILEAPAAYCMRTRSFRPEQLPCLPAIDFNVVNPEDVVPDLSNCRPRECGYAVHVRKHKDKASKLRQAAEKLAAEPGLRAELKDEFEAQAIYWRGVENVLVNGAKGFDNIESIDVDVGRGMS